MGLIISFCPRSPSFGWISSFFDSKIGERHTEMCDQARVRRIHEHRSSQIIQRSLLDPVLHPVSNCEIRTVWLLFDSLMMRGVVEYNPAARAKPPRLVRESSDTPVFEEAEIVAFLDSISLDSLKDIRDKAIFSVLLYSWCRVSALINLSVGDYYERGGARWLRFQEKRGKEHEVPVHSKAKEAVDLWLERSSSIKPECSTFSFLRQES